MLDNLFRNWKTTLIGVGILGLTVVFVIGRIDLQQFIGGFGALVGAGLMAAKDSTVSGPPTK